MKVSLAHSWHTSEGSEGCSCYNYLDDRSPSYKEVNRGSIERNVHCVASSQKSDSTLYIAISQNLEEVKKC